MDLASSVSIAISPCSLTFWRHKMGLADRLERSGIVSTCWLLAIFFQKGAL